MLNDVLRAAVSDDAASVAVADAVFLFTQVGLTTAVALCVQSHTHTHTADQVLRNN